MDSVVKLVNVEAQSLEVVHGRAAQGSIPAAIKMLYGRFYADFKSKGELNTVLYSACHAGEMDIACGVQVTSGGNASTPAGPALTTTHLGPYDRMKSAHDAIHRFAKSEGHHLTGVSWEVYGHWNADPNQLRTDIFYQLAPATS